MAFQPYRTSGLRDDLEDHSSVSLAGIIKLQPSRRKANRSWRPMEASDLGEPRNASGDGNFHFTGDKVSCDVISKLESRHPFIDPQSRLSNIMSIRDEMDGMYDDTNIVGDNAVFGGAMDSSIGQEEAVKAGRLHLFGNLPDPILLSEQLGQFDGQVVYIGHPNRDISAHQWSSSSFQWVNIGRYSSSLGRVEGSLASDRPQGLAEAHDTIEYFKLAADNRQALMLEYGRSEDQTTLARSAVQASVDTVEWPQVSEKPSNKGVLMGEQTRSEAGASFPSTTHALHGKDVLQDPFVASANVSLANSIDGHRFKNNAANSTGTLDLAYKFPTQKSVATSSVIGSSAFSVKSLDNSSGQPCASEIQEVAFGEEAATRRVSLRIQAENDRQLPSSIPHHFLHDHSEPLNKVEDPQLNLPWPKVVGSSVRMANPVAELAAPTRSVLRTKYTPSNLSATAAPYAQGPTGHVVLQRSESNAGTVKAGSVALRYSDPDGLRKTQQYEVANGLTQQVPTAQNFKGPFFTDSKPTAHNPTVSLSVHMSEEEKLTNWFRDGQRPARQREYTKSLIAAAVASDRNRYFGAIGQVPSTLEEGPYANTGSFVRLYENLSEYVEEHRNRGDRSYFTRQWKAAAPKLREGGVEYSRSYFGKDGTRPLWPGPALLRPLDRVWG